MKRLIAAVLVVLLAAPASPAEEESARHRQIERICTARECPRVRSAASKLGLDPDRLDAGLPRLTDAQLEELAALAEAHQKPGGCVRLDFPWWLAPALLLGFLAVVAGVVAGIVGIIRAIG